MLPVVTAVRDRFPDLVISVDTWRARGRARRGRRRRGSRQRHLGRRRPERGRGRGGHRSRAGLQPHRWPEPTHRRPPGRLRRRGRRRRSALTDAAAQAVAAGVRPDGILHRPDARLRQEHPALARAHPAAGRARRDRLAGAGRVVTQGLHRRDAGPARRRAAWKARWPPPRVCAWQGARVFRAHDVRATRRVLDMVASIRGTRPPAVARRGLGLTRRLLLALRGRPRLPAGQSATLPRTCRCAGRPTTPREAKCDSSPLRAAVRAGQRPRAGQSCDSSPLRAAVRAGQRPRAGQSHPGAPRQPSAASTVVTRCSASKAARAGRTRARPASPGRPRAARRSRPGRAPRPAWRACRGSASSTPRTAPPACRARRAARGTRPRARPSPACARAWCRRRRARPPRCRRPPAGIRCRGITPVVCAPPARAARATAPHHRHPAAAGDERRGRRPPSARADLGGQLEVGRVDPGRRTRSRRRSLPSALRHCPSWRRRLAACDRFSARSCVERS